MDQQSPPAEAAPKHIFNNDLLIPRADGTNPDFDDIAQHNSDLLFAFDFPALRTLFVRVDEVANAQKRGSRTAGFVAVGLASASLAIASASPIFPEDPGLHAVLGLVAAIFGVLGVIVGLLGVVRGGAKLHWLEQRLCTERMRQFFFQNMVMCLPDMIDALGDDVKKKVFRGDSVERLLKLRNEVIDLAPERLKDIVEEPHSYGPDWLIAPPDAELMNARHAKAAAFYALYRRLRFEHQISFSRYKLDKTKPTPLRSLRTQETLFSMLALAGVGILFVMHLTLGALIAAGARAELSPWWEVIVVWIALGALVLKAMEEGLQPQREVERYEDYLANCQLALERFERTTTGPDARKPEAGAETFRAMLDFERVVYEEMKHFLRTNYRAHFLL